MYDSNAHIQSTNAKLFNVITDVVTEGQRVESTGTNIIDSIVKAFAHGMRFVKSFFYLQKYNNHTISSINTLKLHAINQLLQMWKEVFPHSPQAWHPQRKVIHH